MLRYVYCISESMLYVNCHEGQLTALSLHENGNSSSTLRWYWCIGKLLTPSLFGDAISHAVNSYCEVIEWNTVWFQWDRVVGTLPEGCFRVVIGYQGPIRERDSLHSYILAKTMRKESANSHPRQALSTDKSPLVLMAWLCLPFIMLTNKAGACSSNVSLPVVWSSQGGWFGWPQSEKFLRSEETLAWVLVLHKGLEVKRMRAKETRCPCPEWNVTEELLGPVHTLILNSISQLINWHYIFLFTHFFL